MWKRLLFIAGACLGVGVLVYVLWNNGVFLPGWITWEEGRFCAVKEQYEVVLEHRRASLWQDQALLWNSPESVKVQAACSFDIDNDGAEELILLCWKKGRYGRSRPFWVEQDERGWSQHLFVYAYTDAGVRPKWMSSYLGQDAAGMRVSLGRDLRGRLWLEEPDGRAGCFVWNSWGFVKEDTEVSFAVFGDNLIHEPIYRYGLSAPGSSGDAYSVEDGAHADAPFGFLFENMRETIARCDVAVINQETPFVEDPARYGGYPRFGTPLSVGEAIAEAGFDAVTCATNHALDGGAEGVNTTKTFFDSQGVLCLGIQTEAETEERPYEILTVKGMRFALFNYTYGTNGIAVPAENPHMVHLLEDEEKIRQDVERAGTESDFVIVFVHWGTEYEERPDAFQQKWAQIFLECRADVVIGTHPHVLQPHAVLVGEDGHEMLLYYSIGNYISAQHEKICVKGGMASFTVSLTPDGCRIAQYCLRPLAVTGQGSGKFTTDFAVFTGSRREEKSVLKQNLISTKPFEQTADSYRRKNVINIQNLKL